MEKYHNRTSKKRCTIYMIRLAINLVIICILVGCAAAVTFTQAASEDRVCKHAHYGICSYIFGAPVMSCGGFAAIMAWYVLPIAVYMVM